MALTDGIVIRKLKIGDASVLRRSKFLDGTLEDVTNKTRELIDSTDFSYVAVKNDSNIIAIANIRYRNSSHLVAELELLTEQYGTIYPSDDDLMVIVDGILNKAFLSKGLYKVTMTIAYDNSILEKILAANGFVQEAVLHAELYRNGQYEDASLFYMVAPEYRKYNVCFVPFQRGILSVYGGMDYVDRVEFNKYGGEPVDKFTRDAAYYAGILDEDGMFLKRGAPEFDYDIDEFDYMPYELKRAFVQLREYFAKDRENFDINVRITREITPFQKQVWDVLKTIPYGATYSYEDVALTLTNDNIKDARKLTRAVGAACSENPVPIFVPCHRVIGKDGRLVGFAGGVEFKDFLLQQEAFPAALL